MKLSGHNFDNAVFNSLLDNLKDDIVLNKKADKEQPEVSVGDWFSTTTADTLSQIREEELEYIAAELEFAADRAKVALNAEDLAKFAIQSTNDGLRGKELERAAQKYCSSLDRAFAAPSSDMRTSKMSIADRLLSKVASATYDPDAVSENKTGKYMGCMRNPNTIWDTDEMQKLAQKQTGDEQIRASKKAREDAKQADKQDQWQELQDKHSDPNQIHKGITNSGTAAESEEVVDQKLPLNAMSIFSEDRDFNNLPEKTAGEEIGQLAEERANKKGEAKGEWNQVNPAPKMASTSEWFDKLFNKKS